MLVTFLSVFVSGCKKPFTGSGFGTISFDLTASGEYVTKAGAVSVDDFTVTITRTSDGWRKYYEAYGQIPESIVLPSGAYKIEVSSPEALPAAFDQPVYGGSAEFGLHSDETMQVSVKATLANMKVTLNPDSVFLGELASFTVLISNGDGAEHSLMWSTDDIRNGSKEGYFSVAPLKIHVDGYRTIDGSPVSYDGRITDVAAADHHIINLSARTTGQVGGITIIVDGSTNDKITEIEVPGFDEIPVPGEEPEPGTDPEPEAAAPSLEWPANPDFEPAVLTSDLNVDLVVKAPGKIRDFIVSVSDNFKNAIAAIATEDEHNPVDYMDLINNQFLITNLKDVAPDLPTGDALKGQTTVDFKLSGMMPLLAAVAEPGDDIVFTLSVTDELGQALNKSIIFRRE